MDLSHTWMGTTLVLSVLEKELAMGKAKEFKTTANAFIQDNPMHILIDLSKVSKLDSRGLAALIFCFHGLKGKGKLCLCGLKEPIRNILEMTQLNTVFWLYPNIDTAIQALSQSASPPYVS